MRRLAGVVAEPGGDVVAATAPRALAADGYRLEDVTLESEPGVTLDGVVAIPAAPGTRPAVVWAELGPVLETDGLLGTPGRVRISRRGGATPCRSTRPARSGMIPRTADDIRRLELR